MPEMQKNDLVQVSSTLDQLVSALSVAVQDLGVVSRETAAEAVAKVLAEMGIEYDVKAELEAIDQSPEWQARLEAMRLAMALGNQDEDDDGNKRAPGGDPGGSQDE
jgi:hypothetical protein